MAMTNDEITKAMNQHRSTRWFRSRVSPEQFKIIQGLATLSNRSYGRSQYFGWDWNMLPWVLWKLYLKQEGRCAVTGKELSFDRGTPHRKNPWACSIDRIDSKKGYVSGNVRLVTHWYNNAKNTWDDDIVLEAVSQWTKSKGIK